MIEGPEQVVTLKKIERTTSIVWSFPYQGDPMVDFTREAFWLNGTDKFGPSVMTTVRKTWGEIKDLTWTLEDGTKLSAAQVVEALSIAFDQLSST